MDQKQSQFTEVTTLIDTDYVPVFGAGTNRKILKTNLFGQIKDETEIFIYPTIELLQAADLVADPDWPVYVRVEETGYKLYKITSLAAGANDISLTNGTTATLQSESVLQGNVATFAALASTPATVDQIVKVAQHTSGGIGGGDFIGVSGSVTNDGGTQINSATAGVYWKRIGYADLDAAFFNVVSDGSTDQTSKLLTIFTSLSAQSFRGILRIQYNTKFTISTVYAAVYVGLILEDWSSINYGQPPGYKNKFLVTYAGDSVSDDSQFVVSSGHNPTYSLNNFGTSGSASAAARYTTIQFAGGIRWNGDMIVGLYQQNGKASGKNSWRHAWYLNTPWLAATDKGKWTTGTVYTAGDYVDVATGQYYTTAAGGTSGGTVPSHNVGTVSDGGVLWTYVGQYNAGATRFYFDEDGEAGHLGASSVRLNFDTALDNGFAFEYRYTSTDIAWTDKKRSRDIIRVSDGLGTQLGGPVSIKFSTVTGATPTANTNGLYVNNAGATNMTGIVNSGTMTDQIVVLQFSNGNTTLVNSGTFNLKGGVNVTPTAGQFVTMLKNSNHSSGWFEYSRSF